MDEEVRSTSAAWVEVDAASEGEVERGERGVEVIVVVTVSAMAGCETEQVGSASSVKQSVNTRSRLRCSLW